MRRGMIDGDGSARAVTRMSDGVERACEERIKSGRNENGQVAHGGEVEQGLWWQELRGVSGEERAEAVVKGLALPSAR